MKHFQKKTYEPSIYCMSSSANIWVEHKQKLVGGFQPIWKNINSISSSPQVGATIRECCKAPRKSLKPPNRKLSPHRKLSRTPYQSLPVASSQYKRKGLRVEQKQIFHRRMERGSMVLWVKTLLKKNIRIYIYTLSMDFQHPFFLDIDIHIFHLTLINYKRFTSCSSWISLLACCGERFQNT